MSHRRMAILEFSLGRLREALQLPEEAEIIGAEIAFDTRDRLLLKIEGAGFPVAEGWQIPRTTAMVTQYHLEDGTELMPKIEWNFNDDVPNEQED